MIKFIIFFMGIGTYSLAAQVVKTPYAYDQVSDQHLGQSPSIEKTFSDDQVFAVKSLGIRLIRRTGQALGPKEYVQKKCEEGFGHSCFYLGAFYRDLQRPEMALAFYQKGCQLKSLAACQEIR